MKKLTDTPGSDHARPILPLSQSRHGDMACETLYVRKHVQRAKVADSEPAARGIEIHRVVAAYINHLVSTRRSTDVYWISLVTLVDWICNVLMPVYAGLQVAAGALRMGVVTRVHPTEGWMRHFVAAGLCLLLSGLLRLAEFFVARGTAGIP